jgi:hypothetical protein
MTEGALTVSALTEMVDKLERMFPRKTTPAAMRMNAATLSLIRNSIPIVGSPIRPLMGMRFFEDSKVAHDSIEVLNRDYEVIQIIVLSGRAGERKEATRS